MEHSHQLQLVLSSKATFFRIHPHKHPADTARWVGTHLWRRYYDLFYNLTSHGNKIMYQTNTERDDDDEGIIHNGPKWQFSRFFFRVVVRNRILKPINNFRTLLSFASTRKKVGMGFYPRKFVDAYFSKPLGNVIVDNFARDANLTLNFSLA